MAKNAVMITGTGRGLGSALAFAFGKQEYHLILQSRQDVWRDIPGKITVVRGDLREEKTLLSLVGVAEEGGVDILVHNAGIYPKRGFADLTGGDWQECFDVNLLAPINLTRHLWPLFERQSTGLIVFINSLAGKQGGDGQSAYAASKHGLSGFARSLQFDATRIGVKVLSVFLGAMQTDMTRHRPDWDKLMDPQEVARTIVGLCEDRSTLGIREVEIGRTSY